MEYAKLLKTTISANYVWQGDRLYISTKWQALNETDFAGKVRIDFEFGYQRITENIADLNSFSWRIYPEMYTWSCGKTYETAGALDIPQIWGGTRHVYVSLLDDNGNPVPFLDENNELVLRANVADIEFCFASGSDYLRSLTKTVETEESEKAETEEVCNHLYTFECDEFNKYGIDVTSETVAYHFIGRTGHGWLSHSNGTSELYMSEKKIPLTNMLYHGIIPYAAAGTNKTALMNGFSFGLKSCWGDSVVLDDDRIMSHYILSIPMLLFENLKMEDYIEDNGVITEVYEDGSKVITDMAHEEYEVIYKGKTIAKNWQTYSPGENDNVLYLYLLEDMNYKSGRKYHFYELTKGGAKDLGIAKELEIKAKTPVKGVKIEEGN